VVTAFNPALMGALEVPRQEFLRSVREVLALVDQDALRTACRRQSAAFSDSQAQALTRNFKLHDAVIGLLDTLMQTRIDTARASRTSAIAYVGAITLVGIVAAFWVSHAASTRLRLVADAVRQTAAGKRHGPIAPSSDDEVGALVEAVNRLVESNHAGAAGLVRHVEVDEAPEELDETLAEENLPLKVLVADPSLENQALRTRNTSEV
jgi:HAMP domain-containing protein